MRFDENLRNLRKEKDYSQEYLAERLGVTRQTISKWENGTAMPDLKKLIELADFFETSMDDLLGLDYKTMNPKQNFAESGGNDYNGAEAVLANRYTNDLINRASNRMNSKTKGLSILLAFVAIGLAISVIFISGTISTLQSQISGLHNSISYLQQNNQDSNHYDDEEEYYVEVKVLRVNPKTPYIIQAEFKYAPTSYPKNSSIYYLLPKKDGGVERIEAVDNNGDFVAKADIDLSLDKPVYFVLDDGKNIIKQEVYIDPSDIYGHVSYVCQYEIVEKKNSYTFSTNFDSIIQWYITDYATVQSADLVVRADSKEVYRNTLKQSAFKEDDSSLFCDFQVPDFTIEDLKKPKEIDIYIEFKLDKNIVCKAHLEHNKPMYYTEESMEEVLSQSYTEYVFLDGDKTITVNGIN
ncbi:MAG: helix-turn-helix domain-containing protein [Eubacterium sp.]|nr:helix-turn-helix domain-containing protein [Eubacterium sp.]